jgi:hypothetical protein
MRTRHCALLGALLVCVVVVAACTPRGERVVADPSVRTGEKLRRVVISHEGGGLAVGGLVQLTSRMYFSRGGELPGVPYVRYRSLNPVVAAVDESTGWVRGRSAGAAPIVAEFAGRADTLELHVGE